MLLSCNIENDRCCLDIGFIVALWHKIVSLTFSNYHNFSRTLNLDYLVQDDLNYRMMVERYLNLKEEVGDSNPDYEISSLLDKKLVK